MKTLRPKAAVAPERLAAVTPERPAGVAPQRLDAVTPERRAGGVPERLAGVASQRLDAVTPERLAGGVPERLAGVAPERLAAVAVDWFGEHARDLPWRRAEAGAWAVLVSEIMLQQTPVARVLPVYQAWLERWPKPAALAADSPGEAVRAWGRLGYPRRALRLHECARAIVDRHGGDVPDVLSELLALPGVGAYTARAVASFAYGQRHPVVDTNVRRLVARAVHGAGDAGRPSTARDLAAMEPLLPTEPEAAARFAVAVMELGALICTARAPRCADCPLARDCAWRRAGSPAHAGPSRRTQTYAGTDRQVRGLLLAVLRESDGPVGQHSLDAVWPDPIQRARALDGLAADGLVDPLPDGRFALPSHPAAP